jgi:hypothetical protein
MLHEVVEMGDIKTDLNPSDAKNKVLSTRDVIIMYQFYDLSHLNLFSSSAAVIFLVQIVTNFYCYVRSLSS